MWIVRLALRRPYTFVVAAMLVAILGVVTILRMGTDIFPEIDIPVISVIWGYTGMTPDEMEKRMVSGYERALTTTVNDIEHIESQSLSGMGVVKIFFQPGAKIEAATAQVTAISQSMLKTMPPGTLPPLVIRYSASNVPILQASLSSDTLPEQRLFDLAVNFLRTQLAVVQGAQMPWPYGGKTRQIMVDLEPDKLFAMGISPQEVSEAINAQNLILPAGGAKIGNLDYQVRVNSSPSAVALLNELPVKTINGTTIKIKDVANVRDGFSVQTSIAHADGKRGVLVPIYKSAGSSTLDIVSRVRAALPLILQTLPKDLKLTLLFDQSVFVRAAVNGVIKEAAIAAGLTALMILLFLGSWRSTLIVIISIPLSIIVSIVILSWLGHTLNVMTLGGMALAVGILVDDATVEIENIHRNLHQKKRLVQAILDGARQIAVPAFVSTLCICIVFVPVVFISGAAKSLFTPLAMAVVFAMLTSYLLSRTLVPTMIHYLLAAEVELYGGVEEAGEHHRVKHGLMWHFHEWFNRQFDKLRRFYGGLLAWSLSHRGLVVLAFIIMVAGSCGLFTLIGSDFFPSVDAGQIRLHVRAPAGTRIEETERIFGQVEQVIRQDIPADEISIILDNMGIPVSGINLSLSDGTLISAAEGEILVALKEDHKPTAEYISKLRKHLRTRFPQLTCFFQPADIATQVLNFGLSAPIDIQVVGPMANAEKNLAVAQKIQSQVGRIPGAVDVHIQQVPRAPAITVDVDRTLAGLVGVTQRDVAGNLLVSLSSSSQTAPNFWLNPLNGVSYSLMVQTPQYRLDSINAIENTPIVPTGASAASREPQILGNLAAVGRSMTPTNLTHYNIAPTYDVLASVQGADLGAVASEVQKVIDRAKDELPPGSQIVVRGQVQSMQSSFTGLGFGLIFAVILVYLLMVINFQSWLDPLIILMALPGALAGILWMLFVTGTTLSVPALMGAIMSIGVATANSILMITFANDQRKHGFNSHDASLAAGMTRLRPVMMTALAMIIGMLPMSLGLGEGGEQNAPLGRAVIGGLVMATFATLFFVPVVYSALRHKPPKTHVEPELRS